VPWLASVSDCLARPERLGRSARRKRSCLAQARLLLPIRALEVIAMKQLVAACTC
jgi:hypothetical protein